MKKWIERIKNLSGSTKLFLIGIALLILRGSRALFSHQPNDTAP